MTVEIVGRGDETERLREHCHRLELDSELRTIEAQYLRSRQRDFDQLSAELGRMRDEVAAFRRDAHTTEGDGAEEIYRLREAEHHLIRLLGKVENSPLRVAARRKGGYRRMVKTWL